MESINEHYVYLHIKLDGTPFYVGKGKRKRAYQTAGRSHLWNEANKELGRDALLLEENLTDEKATELEIYWIKRIGRYDMKKGSLVNQTDGGDGSNGYIRSEETRRKISQAKLGNKHNIGRKCSEEKKRKISESKKGKKQSKEHIEKIRLVKSGKVYKLSEEHKIRLTEGRKKNKNRSGLVVLDKECGVFYKSVKDASTYHNMKSSTLYNQLIGVNKNKTNLILV